MNLGEHLNESLKFATIFTVRVSGLEIPITETVVVTWIVMAVLIIPALFAGKMLKEVPKGWQCLLESGIEFLDSVSEQYFGHWAKAFGPYIGTIFLFLMVANIIPAFSPIEAFGRIPPFKIKPPARDINLTAAVAFLTISLVLIGGLRARGLKGWLKNLLYPIPIMLPFNVLDYFIRPLSLCLRLFGNILGGFIVITLIDAVAPIGIPVVLSIYFDFVDGLIQAVVFTFLSVLFISEAVEVQ